MEAAGVMMNAADSRIATDFSDDLLITPSR
jgi:hypothetical protein